MKEWQQDKRWSDRFLPEIKKIIGAHLIAEAPIEEDQQRNTDLIVLKLDAVRVACRVRHFEFYQNWPNDFTIREGRPSGIKTELSKIIEGWGQYLFYGFSGPDEHVLVSWKLLDLNVFRLWFNRFITKNAGVLPGNSLSNGDGSSTFRAFSTLETPENLIFAQVDLSSVKQGELF